MGSRKAATLGRANWIAGIAYGSQQKWGPADKALRAALPSVKGDPQLLPLALFHLGLSNYNLGKIIGDKAKTREGLALFPTVRGDFEQRSRIKLRRT